MEPIALDESVRGSHPSRSGALGIPVPLLFFASLWTAVFFGAFILFPLFALFSRVASAPRILDPEVLSLARFTFKQAGLSALLSALIGLPLGLYAGTARGRWRSATETALSIPFGVPTVVAGAAWVAVLGRSGVLARIGVPAEPLSDWIYSFRSVILAHVVFNSPWIALLVARARSDVPERELDAARTLGAGAFARWRAVVWPRVRWAYLSGTTQAFVFCAMSFALVLLLGGGPPVETLETALYSKLRFGTVDLSGAASCAFWQLGICLFPWAAVLYFQNRDRGLRERVSFSPAGRSSWGGGLRFAAAMVFILPYLTVLFPWSWILRLAPSAELWLGSLRISATLALGAASLSVVSAAAAVVVAAAQPEGSRRRILLNLIFGLPSGISALVLGLGFWLAYSGWIDPFDGSRLAMIAIQAVLFLTIAYRMLWPLSQSARKRSLEAALTLGASPLRAFYVVEWPRWKPSVAGAFAIVAGASLGEIAAVSLFYSENLVPLPLLISRWMAQYRFDEAQALAALLFILSAGVIGIVLWRSVGESGSSQI